MIRALTDLENWSAHARDTNGELYMSNLFVIACSNNVGCFEEAKRVVHAAFEAGRQAGLNISNPQPQVNRT